MNITRCCRALPILALVFLASAIGQVQKPVVAPVRGGAPLHPVTPDNLDLPGFTRISDKLALGAQPTTMGIRKIADMGFRSVLNLVSLKEGSMLESKTVEFYGMKFLNIEFTADALNDALVEEFNQTIENPDNHPIFVHCKTGNRIAALWMIYRVQKQGWKQEAALEEAARIGLNESPIRDAVLKYLKTTN